MPLISPLMPVVVLVKVAGLLFLVGGMYSAECPSS